MDHITYQGSSIASMQSLARTLSVDPGVLERLLTRIGASYNYFTLPKRTTGQRQIASPKPLLKALQQRINSRIFTRCAFPAYLQGSIKDPMNPRDFVTNAVVHSKSEILVCLDIKDFYPSIQKREVFKIFKYLFQFKDEVATTLTALVCLEKGVPQGAPTSSYIANMIFYDREPRLVQEFQSAGFLYTRLLDDITVSFVSSEHSTNNRTSHVIQKVRAMFTEKGFVLHPRKLKIDDVKRSSQPAVVTGLTIKNGHVGLARSYRERTRAKVHSCLKQFEAGQGTESAYHELHNSASGDVTLLKRLGYKAADQYRVVLSACQPTYSKKEAGKVKKFCLGLEQKLNSVTKEDYTGRYNLLLYKLSILGRTRPRLASALGSSLRAAMAKANSSIAVRSK